MNLVQSAFCAVKWVYGTNI